MSSEQVDHPPLLQMYVPRRAVYGGDVVLQQPSEHILVVRRSVLSRVSFLTLAVVIGCLCSASFYWICQLVRLEAQFRIYDEKVLAAALAAAGLLFSLALGADMLLKGPIRFDRDRRTVERCGWFPGWWECDLDNVVAVQVCYGKSHVSHDDRRSRPKTLQYQVNPVFRDRPSTRRNVSEQGHRVRIKRIGRQIADFLAVPLLDYVGPAGTMDAADAEARRLLS